MWNDYKFDCFTNLRFADDVFLVCFACVDPKMMCDFKWGIETVGLKIHPDKTEILSNQSANIRKEVEINNNKVETFVICV